MKTVENIDRREATEARMWEKFGEHAEAIATLKSSHLQTRQDLINHRAETLSMFGELKKEIIAIVQPISGEVSKIKDFIKRCLWVGTTAVTVSLVIIGAGCAIVGYILAHYDAIKPFIGK